MAIIPNEFSVVFEIEPIVKLRCGNTMCKHNLINKNGWFACNLKNVTIGINGICESCTYEYLKRY